MTPGQQTKLGRLAKSSLKTAMAWRFKEFARGLWEKRPRFDALVDWMGWCTMATQSGIQPIVKVAETIRRHAYNIAVAIEKGISNAASESINSGIKKLSVRAHGFRNSKRFINAIYFHFGKLDLYPSGAAMP